MISLETLRRQMTLRAFVIIAGIVAAPILGVAMAEASRGQIVLLAKHSQARGWRSLSVPRGRSEEFNQRVHTGEASQR